MVLGKQHDAEYSQGKSGITRQTAPITNEATETPEIVECAVLIYARVGIYLVRCSTLGVE